jgi:hypothetical protein
VCGANKFKHTEVTRHDEVIRQFWGFERMAGHKSFQRFFNKFDLATNLKVFTPLYQRFFKNLQFTNLTLDVDSTIHTRYGTQQGCKERIQPKAPLIIASAKTYNLTSVRLYKLFQINQFHLSFSNCN